LYTIEQTEVYVTGIERHWQEVEAAERGVKLQELADLQKRVSWLLWELYPQQQAMMQMQNVGMSAAQLQGLTPINSLLGPLFGTGAVTSQRWL
jgi:glutathionylspermidine synthase